MSSIHNSRDRAWPCSICLLVCADRADGGFFVFTNPLISINQYLINNSGTHLEIKSSGCCFKGTCEWVAIREIDECFPVFVVVYKSVDSESTDKSEVQTL